ncbi:DUF4221 family protein [Cognataquiflexum aquatile]|uniref:DUF4221 family protein n=1 Tax=Cognataquiflexum aquatile TaxID=2249427 RepID=UPI000DEA4699|nr:DUF4221 family protein [Cognataquiflexum aquatile]
MRYFTFLILVLTISCSDQLDDKGWGYFSDFHVTIDTLIIESGDEILYLNDDIIGADLSIDHKYLYNFNPYDHTLEKINLDELKLEVKLLFEKEGPNGTGQITGGIEVHDETKLVIQRHLFSFDGKKLLTIHPENFSLGWENGEIPNSKPVFDMEVKRLFLLIQKIEDKSNVFGILDLNNYEIFKLPLQSFDEFKDYTFTLWRGKSSVSIGPKGTLDRFGTKVIISNQLTSLLTVYDIELDSLYFKTNNSQLTANKKSKIYKTEHEAEQSIEAEYTRFHQEINFLPPFWDNKNQVFYRFSYQQLPSESKEEQYIKSKIYLAVLDKNLKLIGEVYLPYLKKPAETPFSKPFPKHFAKDGKIWIYENINDEMGFVVLSFNN